MLFRGGCSRLIRVVVQLKNAPLKNQLVREGSYSLGSNQTIIPAQGSAKSCVGGHSASPSLRVARSTINQEAQNARQ